MDQIDTTFISLGKKTSAVRVYCESVTSRDCRGRGSGGRAGCLPPKRCIWATTQIITYAIKGGIFYHHLYCH